MNLLVETILHWEETEMGLRREDESRVRKENMLMTGKMVMRKRVIGE